MLSSLSLEQKRKTSILLTLIISQILLGQSITQTIISENSFYSPSEMFVTEAGNIGLIHLKQQNDSIAFKYSSFSSADLSLLSDTTLGYALPGMPKYIFKKNPIDQGLIHIVYGDEAMQVCKTFQLNSSGNHLTLFNSITLQNRRPIRDIFIHNNEIYIRSSNRWDNQPTDSTDLEVFDLNGTLIRHKTYTINDSNIGYNYGFLDQFWGQIDKSNIQDSIVKVYDGYKPFTFNTNTLDIDYIIPPFSSAIFTSFDSYDYHTFYNNGFSTGGTTSYDVTGGSANPNFVPQTFILEASFDGTYSQVRKFGIETIEERCYAYNYDETQFCHFTASNRPFFNPSFDAAESRDIVIRRITNWGDDSLIIPSQRNYVSYDIEYADNDLFILSRYNDSINGNLREEIRKVSHIALSKEDLEVNSTLVELYPNPSTDVLHINLGVQASTVQILDITGSLLEVQYCDRNTIRTYHLSPGIHFIKLFDSANRLIASSKFVKI